MKVDTIVVLIFVLHFTSIEADKKQPKENLLHDIKTELFQNGFPKLSYYDSAKLIDDAKGFYEDFRSKFQSVKLDQSTSSAFTKELLTKSSVSLFAALQKLYSQGLDSFDNVLDLLVNVRKVQKKAQTPAGQAIVDMYTALIESDAKENKSLTSTLDEFLRALGKLNRDAVKNMFKLAKMHEDLQALMNTYEDATVELKKLCKKYAKLADLSIELGEKVADASEPFVTLILLGTFFGF